MIQHDVTILGCGPAGLLAAHAAISEGRDVTIYSKKEKSHIHGAQYIHVPIPGVHEPHFPDGMINYKKTGTKEGYAKKVYGDPNAPCSWDKFKEGDHPAWSMQGTYDVLWNLYKDKVLDVELDPIAAMGARHTSELVISSIPAPVLCANVKHKFDSVDVSFLHIAADPSGQNTVVYNGGEHDEWYRASTIFGQAWTEFPGHNPIADIEGIKPLSTDCDCLPGIHRVGRFGCWKKGVLVSDAYHAAKEIVRSSVEVH